MRKVLTREEIDELIRKMPDENNIWIEDEAERKEGYRRILRSGNRMELVMLIKTLYCYREDRRGKKKEASLRR